MSHNESDNLTFQVTVIRLTLSSPLPRNDIRVTVAVGDVSKITCPGEVSQDGLVLSWNHPFLFTASPSASIRLGIYALPELAPGWDKQPLGDQMAVNLTTLLESGIEWQGNILGLSDGFATLFLAFTACDKLVVPDDHDCLSTLGEYFYRLWEFSSEFKSLSCLSTQIEVALTMLDQCPLDHEDHGAILLCLSVSFNSRYDQGGNISDLNKSIEIQQTRLDLCSLDLPSDAQTLRHLGLSLWGRYKAQKDKVDLDRAIEMHEKALVLCPLGHPDHALALGTLALSLKARFESQGNMSDLNRIIEMEQEGLDLSSPGDPYHAQILGNLAVSLHYRYHRLYDLADLDKAIDLEERKLQLRPPGHRSHGLALDNLAASLQDRFNAKQTRDDLTRAVQLYRNALATYPVQHPYFASCAIRLAKAILLQFQSPQSDHLPPSLDQAFEVYGKLKTCAPAISWDLLEATKSWVRDAEKYNHSSVLEAYQTALNTLDHFTSLSSSLESRHETMQTELANLVNDAFSCAIRHSDFQMAVELLEQGRGILWNQLARFDISIAALESLGNWEHALGNKFTRFSHELREYARGDGDSNAYWRAKEGWQSVVDEIRGLDGFSRFLLPPLFGDLQKAAEFGPVIIVNASKYSCDALIVLRTGLPIHVALPCSLPDIDQLCLQLSELTRDPHAFGDRRESWVKVMLHDLWSTVVEPIADALQYDIQLPLGSRIWWCPTSKFTKLPFHAAGLHRSGQRNMLNLYVSSYAPSLSALVRTHDRIRSQKAARDASGGANPISFVAVGQGRPSTDTKQSELPQVEHEIQRIRDETGMPPPPAVTFEIVTGDAASIDGAVRAFRDHRWVHLACHGSQHADKPFESWFAMGDGKLTLMRIIQERYTNSEFAFLSACHTAVGDASTLDEVLHLAAGMQFAGFNGVIGTLWRVDDAVAHKVGTAFYKEMFRQPVIGFENAAGALNAAVLEMAGEVSLEKRIVFVHIGI